MVIVSQIGNRVKSRLKQSTASLPGPGPAQPDPVSAIVSAVVHYSVLVTHEPEIRELRAYGLAEYANRVLDELPVDLVDELLHSSRANQRWTPRQHQIWAAEVPA